VSRHTLLNSVASLLLLAEFGIDSTFVSDSNLPTGIYTAVLFRITVDGQPAKDILLADGSLTISIEKNGGTAGSLVLPAGVPGGPVTLPMTGTALISGLTVQFNQTSDSFVRQVTWNRIATALQILNERVGTAVYDVTLTRQ
jgi:hypothetical protein